jgi:hypothetical protein
MDLAPACGSPGAPALLQACGQIFLLPAHPRSESHSQMEGFQGEDRNKLLTKKPAGQGYCDILEQYTAKPTQWTSAYTVDTRLSEIASPNAILTAGVLRVPGAGECGKSRHSVAWRSGPGVRGALARLEPHSAFPEAR